MNDPPPQVEGEEALAIETAREAVQEAAFPDDAHVVVAEKSSEKQTMRPLKRLRALDAEAAAAEKDGMERVLEVREQR